MSKHHNEEQSSIRRGPGQHNITYRGGAFRLNKFTAEAAGFPSHVEILVNTRTHEVLLKPGQGPHGFKLGKVGSVAWRNSLTSHELARRLQLPLKGETIRFFTRWDAERGVLSFFGPNGKARDEAADVQDPGAV